MSRKIDRTGEISKNNHGRIMQICNYNNANDIDVLFNDGIIVKNKHYSAFKAGSINHPDDIVSVKSYIGYSKQQRNGMFATIIDAENYANITVRFENGIINKTTMGNFLKGVIGTRENWYTEEENELILSLYNEDRDKLLSLLPNRTESSIKSQYYKLNPDIKGQISYGTIHEDYPELWGEVLKKEENLNTTAGSKVPILWRFSCGHIGHAKPVQRLHDMGCPFCNRKRVLAGFNDLETINPKLAKQWNYELNNILPSEVLPNSNKTVWWKCEHGHEWKASINNRNRKHYGCPICTKLKNESIGERLIKEILEDMGVPFNREYPINDGISTLFFDFLTNYGAIEFDGEQHFRPVDWFGGQEAFIETQMRDARKNNYCKTHNIPLLRIRYDEINDIKKVIVHFIKENKKYERRVLR